MEIYVQHDGEQFGPYSVETICSYLAADVFLSNDLVWTAALGEWTPLTDALTKFDFATATALAKAYSSPTASLPVAELNNAEPETGNRKGAATRLRVAVIAGVASVGVIAGAAWFWTANQRNPVAQHPNPTDAPLTYSDAQTPAPPPQTTPKAKNVFDQLAAPGAKDKPPFDPNTAFEVVTNPTDAPANPAKTITSYVAAKREPFDLVALAKKTRSAVVLIEVFDESNKAVATGSGFFISDDGMLVTNFHVIENAQTVIARAENGAMYQVAGAISADQKSDLALLKAAAKGMPFLTLGDSQKAETGEQVAVIGSPLGLEGTLSAGIISAKRDLPTGEQWLQITAPISPGSSGSPVMNANGEVVGVASMLLRDSQALNFAIPSNTVKALVKKSEGYTELLPFASIQEKHQLSEKVAEFKTEAARSAAKLEVLDEAWHSPEMAAASNARDNAMRTADWSEALRVAQVLVSKFPTFATGYSLLGAAYKNMGFSEDAVLAYQRAVKLDAGAADAWLSLGSLFTEQRKTSQATSAFSQALAGFQQELKEAGDDNARANILFSLGNCYAGLGNREAARSVYQEVTKNSSVAILAWDELGKLYADDGDEQNAVAAFYKTLDKKSESDAWKTLASYYKAKGLTEKASEASRIGFGLYQHGR